MGSRRPTGLRLLGRPTFGGLVLGLVFWWRSLTPTLMPRSVVSQALISALCLAIGYGFGTLAGAVGHRLLRRYDREPSPLRRRRAWLGLGVVAGIVVVAGLLLWGRWQNGQRELVSLEPSSLWSALPMLVLTGVVTVVLVLTGRLIGKGAQAVDRFNRRHLPPVLAAPLTVVLLVVLTVFVVRDVVVDRFADWADSAYGALDEGTNEGTEQPDSPAVSGSPESLVPWETLGVQGRDFVAQATPEEALAAFWGEDGEVVEPVRVYVGLDSAASSEARADLAVQDLERAGGFEREVLVVATTTGTGWVDPDAAEAIEQLHGGDTAIVAQQYSFLPSWIGALVEDDRASEAGTDLFEAVYREWSTQPEDDRPALVVFGLSLGSFGAEAPFAGADGEASVANILARTDGALFVGGTYDNRILSQLTEERDEGSPVWRPVVDDGLSVRFVNRDPDASDLGDWPEPRLLYIQHPSDPVTFVGPDAFWSPPEWMDQPRGFDVPDQGGWFPIVTGVQGVFDLMAGFAAPPGFGHDYRLDYVDGWAAVVPPEGWTEADTARLESLLFED